MTLELVSRWVQFSRSGDVLHRLDPSLEELEELVDESYLEVAVVLCGRRGRVSLPGLFSRMGAPRCRRCCARARIPDGVGTPLNAGMDPACGY